VDDGGGFWRLRAGTWSDSDHRPEMGTLSGESCCDAGATRRRL